MATFMIVVGVMTCTAGLMRFLEFLDTPRR